MADDKRFTRDEVARRGGGGAAVFVIDNLVYDVTAFLDDHPGGHEVLLNAAGRDASEDFDDVGHSLDAKELMRKYLVGSLVDAERAAARRRAAPWGEARAEPPVGALGALGSWRLPVALGLLLTALYAYLFG